MGMCEWGTVYMGRLSAYSLLSFFMYFLTISGKSRVELGTMQILNGRPSWASIALHALCAVFKSATLEGKAITNCECSLPV